MKKKYTALVLEDELLPRLSLLQKLQEYQPEIEVIKDCDNAEQALEEILRHRPEILFLDIQMAGQNSLWLVEQLQNTTVNPYIIFTTAYSDPEYLLKAIKFQTVDYLLKPVNIQELAQAVKKVEDKIDLNRKQQRQLQHQDTFSFKTLNSVLLAKPDDILYCKADGNYCELYLENGTREPVFERLGTVEKRVKGNSIIRAGKSFLINTKYIYKIDYKHNTCLLKSGRTEAKVELSINGIMALKMSEQK